MVLILSIILHNTSLELLKKALDASTLRQQIISDNIANVNTLGYKVKKVSFEDEMIKIIKANGSLDGIEPRVIEESSSKLEKNSNSVDLETEMVNMAKNQLLYNTLIQETSKRLSNIRYIINEGRR